MKKSLKETEKSLCFNFVVIAGLNIAIWENQFIEFMEIRKYTDKDEAQLFNMLRSEGDEWIDYHGEKTRNNYKMPLATRWFTWRLKITFCAGIRPAMSDVDGYYQKLGYSRVGSVFMVEIKS